MLWLLLWDVLLMNWCIEYSYLWIGDEKLECCWRFWWTLLNCWIMMKWCYVFKFCVTLSALLCSYSCKQLLGRVWVFRRSKFGILGEKELEPVMQKLLWAPENTEHVVAMGPQTIPEIKLFMGHAKISEERNTIIAKSLGNYNLSANCCMPFVSSLKVEKVMHTVSCDPCNNVDKQIITQRVHSFLGRDVIF